MVKVICNYIKRHDTGTPYTWDYKGKNLVRAQCPKCRNQISISKLIVKDLMGIEK
jgi:hypothetical protein